MKQTENFPCFFTIKKLINMIDSMLINPYFERDVKGFIIGSDLNTEWNNESKGLSYLSSYVKNKNASENMD